jgi:hypothetical protein
MKVSLACAVLSSMLLMGCDQATSVADPSLEQTKAAEVAYQDLRKGHFDAFLNHLDPKLQAHFQENPKLMQKFSRVIPQGDYKSKTLMVKSFDQRSEFKVSYEIAYPGNLVQYDVSFDKPNGSTKIHNLNIRVFGGS